ncbi:MAG: hypothetical protein GC154_16915 [bacterium]|nr:hypothetical protein [bacterium]
MAVWAPDVNLYSDYWAGFVVYRAAESTGLYLLVTALWSWLGDRLPIRLVYGLYLLIFVKMLLPVSIPWSSMGSFTLFSAFSARVQCSDGDGWLMAQNESPSLHAFQGALIGDVYWARAGKRGRGISFDGGFVQLGERENDGLLRYGPDDGFTWALWVKPDGVPRNPPMNHWAFLSRRRFQNTKDQVGLYIGYRPDGRVDFVVSSNKNEEIHAFSRSRIDDGAWRHIALVRDVKNRRFRLYLDGELETTIADPGWDLSAPSSFRIGEEGETYGGTRRYHGLINEIRLYGFPLSGEQVAEVMRGSPQPWLFRSYLFVFWAIVVFLLLLQRIWKEFKVYRIVRSASDLDPLIIPIDLPGIIRKSGVSRRIRWAVSPRFSVPAAYGIFHPTIVFPTHFLAEFSPAEIQWVIFHELSHVKRFDQLVLYWQAAVRIIFFFHPVTRWLETVTNQCQESMCDDFGMERTGIERMRCAECFVRFVDRLRSRPSAYPATQGVASNLTLMKWRLHRICDEDRPLDVDWPLASRLCLLAAALIAVSLGFHAVETERKWVPAGLASPSPRYDEAIASDTDQHTILLFGGSYAPAPETWMWNGRDWETASTDGPSPRSGARMAYDPRRKQTILFGGRSLDRTEYYNDTWVWNQSDRTWTRLNVDGPAPRSGHALIFDPVSETVVLYGGKQGSFEWDEDTWQWDGECWTEVAADGPPPRFNHAMAYDPKSRTIVLMGGESDRIWGDTWEWNSVSRSWTRLSSQGPGALKSRTAHAMAYDPRLRRIVLFGGHDELRSFDDTWIWDGSRRSWTKLLEETEKNSLAYCGMAYDDSRRVLLRFGGVDLFGSGACRAETWEF